ncbi:GNAT family N-acetyltransferase [Sphingomonas aliaeris]|uniref:GNAT family N-acetyltransferase n=1 Tax=Sphingomonas aliaeris TaxID=2759526 RepID=A0A974NWY0_9SPHN|nr:GNAT family N-acetyltransferase [Sphingomonas aliaeris]QQV78407.1 GNAT family N-acetyltransferase [Sphingomonas aliaeris]
MSTVLNVIELRTGSTSDLALVESLMAESFDPRFGEAWTRGQCLGIMALPGVWLTIASIQGQPAGFALSRLTVDEVELLLLATAPAMRRRGVAAALLRSVIGDAQDKRAVALHLEVRDGNEAIKLYRNAGFAKVGQRRAYYRGTSGLVSDAFTYRREL